MHFSLPWGIAPRLIYHFSSLCSLVYRLHCLLWCLARLDMLYSLIHSSFTLILSSNTLHYFRALGNIVLIPYWIDGYRNHCIISTLSRPFFTVLPSMFHVISTDDLLRVYISSRCLCSYPCALCHVGHPCLCVVRPLSAGVLCVRCCRGSTHHAGVSTVIHSY